MVLAVAIPSAPKIYQDEDPDEPSYYVYIIEILYIHIYIYYVYIYILLFLVTFHVFVGGYHHSFSCFSFPVSVAFPIFYSVNIPTTPLLFPDDRYSPMIAAIVGWIAAILLGFWRLHGRTDLHLLKVN